MIVPLALCHGECPTVAPDDPHSAPGGNDPSDARHRAVKPSCEGSDTPRECRPGREQQLVVLASGEGEVHVVTTGSPVRGSNGNPISFYDCANTARAIEPQARVNEGRRPVAY